MRPISRLAFPMVRHYCNRGIPYKTEATHSGVNLTETTPSYRMDQSNLLTDTTVVHSVFSEKKVRGQLQVLGDGVVDLRKDEETGIARITISNPAKANAMSGKMMVDLSDVVDELESWNKGKGVVLHGDAESEHFCAGADLSLLLGLSSPQGGGMMCLFMQNVLGRLQRLPMLSVALVNGKAIGGGAELMTACDFRLMVDDAKVEFKQAKMGLVPGWGGGARLVRLVGASKALKLLAGAQTVSALDAVRIGLADELLLRSGNYVENGVEWLEQYTQASVDIVHGMKNMVQAGESLPLEKAIKVEREIFTGLWGSAEQKVRVERLKEQLGENK